MPNLPQPEFAKSSDKVTATAAPGERSLYDDVMQGAGDSWQAIKDGFNYGADTVAGWILPKYELSDFGLEAAPALPMPGDPPMKEDPHHIPFVNPFKTEDEPPHNYSVCDNPVLAASEPGLCGF